MTSNIFSRFAILQSFIQRMFAHIFIHPQHRLPLRPTYSQNRVSIAAVWSKEVIRSSQLSLTMCHRRLLVVRSYLMIQVRAACDQVPHSQSFSLPGIVQIKRNSVHGNRWDSSSTLTQIHSIWLTVESFVKSNQLPSCIHFFFKSRHFLSDKISPTKRNKPW